MKNIFLILCLIFVSSFASADFSWTDNNWRGKGVSVENVYLQWDEHWVSFSDESGKLYYYYWGTEASPDEKGKLFFSMLLTAFTAGKKVSVNVNDVAGHSNTWFEYNYINLHN
jgi:hypothetical protein